MDYTNNSNKNLISISEGSESEFEKLFHQYHLKLHRFAYIFIKSKELADEVVMDVFYNLWNKKNNLTSITNIETYLFISVRNAAYTLIKKESKFKFEELDQLTINITRYNNTPESKLITSENILSINTAIDTLPSKCKMIFKLIREEGLTRTEVAEILNISVRTIDNQIAIAVKKIAEELNIDLNTKNYSSHIQSFLLLL